VSVWELLLLVSPLLLRLLCFRRRYKTAPADECPGAFLSWQPCLCAVVNQYALRGICFSAPLDLPPLLVVGCGVRGKGSFGYRSVRLPLLLLLLLLLL
jgi:hypothetical protein